LFGSGGERFIAVSADLVLLWKVKPRKRTQGKGPCPVSRLGKGAFPMRKSDAGILNDHQHRRGFSSGGEAIWKKDEAASRDLLL